MLLSNIDHLTNQGGAMKKRALVIAGIIAVLLCLQVSSGKQKGIGDSQSLAVVPPQVPRMDADFGKTSLQFIPNKGQVDGPVAFYVQGRDKTIYFAAEGLTFVLSGPRESTSERWVVKLDFVGANPGAIPVSIEESGAVISYFKGNLEDWKTGLPASSRIVYRELWPGIDLQYYGSVNRMKYEFIVHPGADPSRIKLAYRGAESVMLTEEGRLAIATPAGGFEDDVPIAWQEAGGIKADILVAYVLEAKEERSESHAHIYGFDVGEYDRRLPLVLDPAVFVYCGYIGGAGWEKGAGIAVDGLGNAYVTGDTSSTEETFPVTVGPDLNYNGEPSDAFVAKVKADGTGLVYCSYIGGSGWEEGKGIAVDGLGNAYVTGETSSGDFPVTPGSSLTYNGDIDAFVAKVNADGTELIYSGHIGGWNWDTGKGIAVDGSGNAYVTGWTFSDDLPVKIGPDLTYNSSQDVFVAKVNTAGTALAYCGYIGGWANEEAYGIAVDGSGNAYVTGRTASADDFPIKAGPDLTQNGYYDAFVAKVNAAGSALVYCGYIGGVDDEEGNAIAVDGSGNAYITGYTYSTNFPTVVGPDRTFNGGSTDAFVAKVKADGTRLVYCGYIGGNVSDRGYGNDCGYGIAVDGSGNAYVAGQTDSTEATFPVTVGPDLTYNGLDEAFVAKVKADGTAFAYCGYIGGENNDYGSGIAVDGSGNAYVTGQTDSTEATLPVMVGPDLTFNGSGDYDGFVAKISSNAFGFAMEASPPSATVTAGQSATYTVQVTLQYGSLDSAVSFVCTGLPRDCTASFSPASVTPGANPASTTLTLKTTARTEAATGGTLAASTPIPAALIFLTLAPAMGLWFRFRRPVPVRLLGRWLAAAALIFVIGLIASCSVGGDNNTPGTPAGTYQITIQGESGSVMTSTSVSLIVI
jgi:hypothetical protein